ncbi:hemolysin III family protein [Paracoccus sp. R12_1]|uniref:PAQR family membrane homeostasis protein TrhA n=1 Tax=unclassified Paracoccus (in: a-proteobacteria) TaxID=2688777 RepID=UPI000C0B0894|nr:MULTISPECIES: hemolysin III family protein [unclassified Paracoccus (in: a-proteobacteria)]MBO9456795.1 hemolysin III family protein [Paracoccus sp. R12_2]MBO9487891.1 hemolysin III family protein [Paracoccus sp. R12_1]PHQ68893.1 MAG: DNA-binding protein [Paracoccus sp. (in: a-proteobacteria)]
MSSQFKFGRHYDFQELLADGIVHAIGVLLALIGTAVLILQASAWGSTGAQLAAWVYGLGLVGALAVSFIYNMLPPSRAKWIMRRLDHSAIFILIAATYTPFLQPGIGHPVVFAMLVAIWTMAGLGVTLKCALPGRHDRLAVILYLLMGWSGLVAIGPIAAHLPPLSVILIVVGGVIYSAGVIFHVWERLRFQNAIWHGFVVAAAAAHYGAVLTVFRQMPL